MGQEEGGADRLSGIATDGLHLPPAVPSVISGSPAAAHSPSPLDGGCPSPRGASPAALAPPLSAGNCFLPMGCRLSGRPQKVAHRTVLPSPRHEPCPRRSHLWAHPVPCALRAARSLAKFTSVLRGCILCRVPRGQALFSMCPRACAELGSVCPGLPVVLPDSGQTRPSVQPSVGSAVTYSRFMEFPSFLCYGFDVGGGQTKEEGRGRCCRGLADLGG